MATTDFETVWQRIVEHQGETFYTTTGLEFTYSVDGNTLHTNRTDFGLAKGNFERAYAQVPLDGPGDLTQNIVGPSYCWGVLHDTRISRNSW